MAEDNKKVELASGQIRFLAFSPPPMVAGQYTISAEQELDAKKADKKKVEIGTILPKKKDFYVSAPRFSLNPGAIYNVYPPDNHSGSYFKTLPHIVFSRKTLPWERLIYPGIKKGEQAYAPWMALLLFDEDDLKNNPEIKVHSVTINQLFAGEEPKDLEEAEDGKKPGDSKEPKSKRIFFPPLTKMPWEEAEFNFKESPSEKKKKPRYNVLDIPKALFYDLVPREEELSFLAHAREVNTGDKEISGIKGDGWYSVLIGNRLPTREKKNTVFLVSLEGYQDYLKESFNPAGTSYEKVRLCLLHSWSFLAKGPDFEELTQEINDGAGLLRNPVDGITNEQLKNAFNFGYTGLEHQFRNGDKTVSWYRSPFVPLRISRPLDEFVYHAADGLLRYDEATGMFDVSYASAWQLGRLLAIKNTQFSLALNAWKSQYKKDFTLHLAEKMIYERFQNKADFIQKISDNKSVEELIEEKITPKVVVPKAEKDVEEEKEIDVNEKTEINYEKLRYLLSETWEKMESDELMKNIVLQLWDKLISEK